MNDQAKYTVTLEFETSGADAEINNLRKLQEAVDGVAREGGIGEQSQVKLSKALHNTGVAAGDASSGIKRSEDSLISLRYANYDLASTLFATSAAITVVGAASLVAFAQQESAFTEVERIAGGSLQEIQNLRDELQAMSTDIPVAFGELSNIASLGAALDIPAEQLDEFTESVAKFAATTGITVEAAATGFGKLAAYLQIPEEQFDALGSAILRAGNISVATEEQVLKFAQALALPGARIGFTTDQVVALGATLASFGNINVEGAGSALNRVTKNIERALAENGEDLQNWAATAGMSAEAFRVAWGSDVSGTFNRVIQGLSGNIEGLVGNLDTLGIRNVRDQRILEALALNYDKYNQILGETTSAWREGTYMNEAYGLVLDDLASKFQILLNAFTNFAAAVGAELAPAFGSLTEIVTQALVAVTDFINSPLGGTLTRTVAFLAALAAGYAALRGVIALATASTLAFQFISRSLGGAGIISGLQALATAVLGVGTAGKHGAAGVWSLHGALRSLGRLIVVGAVLSYVSEWIFNTGEAAYNAGVVIGEFANFLLDTGQVINDFFGWGDAAADPTYKAIRKWSQGLKSWGSSLIEQRKNSDYAVAGVQNLMSGVEDLGDSFDAGAGAADNLGEGLGDLAGSAAEAAKEIRTVVDYANDLRSVWDRAFEIRFSGSQSMDAITSTFMSLQEAADAAAKRIRDLRTEIQGTRADMSSLKSDIAIQEYFLSIAIEYGDTQRAAAIEAELGELRADLAKKTDELQDKQRELKDEQDAASKSLKGNSKAAIDNRKSLLDLIQAYKDRITKLVESGASEKEIQQEIAKSKAAFIDQATQLGYSRDEVEKYALAFDDMSSIMKAMPDSVKANVSISGMSPAKAALKEFKAEMSKASGSVDSLRKNLSKGFPSPSFNTKAARGLAISGQIANIEAQVRANAKIGRYSDALDKRLGNLYNLLRSGEYYSGGFTGTGGKYDPAGVVHRGEYVIPKADVNQRTGLPYADALGRLMSGVPGPAPVSRSSGGGSGGVQQVTLSAGSIQALAQQMKTRLYVDGQEIGKITSQAYGFESTVGAY